MTSLRDVLENYPEDLYGTGVDKLDDKQIRRRYLKGNKTVLQNCNCEKIDESERN